MNESDSHDERQLELEENPSSAENSLMDDSGVEEEASQQNQTPNVVDLDKSDPDYEIPNAALTAIQQQQPQQQQNTDLGNFPFRELLAFFRFRVNVFVANFNPALLLQNIRLQAQAFLFRLFHNKQKLNMLENRRINNKSICSTAQNHQKQEHPPPNCLTLSDLPALEEGVRFAKTDIRQRWQFYQPELAKKPAQRQAKPKSKTLVCSRQLFAPERTHSRQGQCSRESMATMGMDLEEDDDLDSISTTSGIFTPCSTIEPCHGHPAAENSKLNTIEQQLASLQKQMALLLQQKQPEKQQVIAEKPKAPPAPPPPAPPLPPSLKADLARAAHKPMPNEQLEMNGGLKKKSPSPTSSFASSNPTAPTMGDLLNDIRKGKKLKKVRRSSNGDLRARKKTLTSQNDGSVAGVLIRALGERRKKMKLDSDTGDGLDDSHQAENGDDAEEEWRVEEATAEPANGDIDNAGSEDGKENNDSVFIEGPSSI